MADHDEAREATTRLALASAFMGPGLPANVFPDLDLTTLDTFVGERALQLLSMLPREQRRKNPDVLVSVLVKALGLGFWAGAAFVVERDKEGGS